MAESRPINASERSGVLAPANLERFSASWLSPAAAVREVVDTYWAVQWNLQPGEQIAQRIVDFPAITLSIESGDVPSPFVITRVRPGAWSRVISGSGSVFAMRLRPAGLAVLSDLPATGAAEQAITRSLDERAYGLLQSICVLSTPEDRAGRADALISTLMRETPLARDQLRANAAVAALSESSTVRSGAAVAHQLGISERTLQRALRATLGIGPNDVARRIRLQEVVRRASAVDADLATIAADLGYADQAHLSNEFRSVAGTTPGRYMRELKQSIG